MKDTSVKDASVVDAPPEGTKARRTHDALLEAMERRLDAGGHAAATTTAVAAEAGVAAGTFYVYFPDRDAALAALLARRLGELLDVVASTLRIEALLDEGLEAVLSRAVGAVLGHFRAHAPALRAALVQLPSSPAIREAYWSAHEATQEELTTFLRRAQTAGMVREADPQLLARTLLVVVQGMNNPLLLARPDDPRTRELEAELVRLLRLALAPPG